MRAPLQIGDVPEEQTEEAREIFSRLDLLLRAAALDEDAAADVLIELLARYLPGPPSKWGRRVSEALGHVVDCRRQGRIDWTPQWVD